MANTFIAEHVQFRSRHGFEEADVRWIHQPLEFVEVVRYEGLGEVFPVFALSRHGLGCPALVVFEHGTLKRDVQNTGEILYRGLGRT